MDEPLYMLTTKDNPYSPFTQFDEWYAWDITHGWHIEQDGSIHLGYCTSAYLANVGVVDTDELSPAQYIHACNDAYDEIVALNVNGKYTKVLESDYAHWKPEPYALTVA